MYMICGCLKFCVHVMGAPEEIQSLLTGPDSPHKDANCPLCGGELTKAEFIDDSLLSRVTTELRELTPKEAHLALEGLGFPEERSCGIDSVSSVLLQGTISGMDAREIRGTGRTVLDSVTLHDGTTIFLASSGWGPLVYRIRPPSK